MSEYEKGYLILFNSVTDALNAINKGNFFLAKEILINAQIDAEQEFIEYAENLNLHKIIRFPDKK